MRQEKYYEAYLDDYDKVIAFMSRSGYEGVSSKSYLEGGRGHLFDLHIQSIETTQNSYNKYTLVLYNPIEIDVECQVIHQHAWSTVLECSGIVKIKRFDEQSFYDGNDLGYTHDRDQIAFALWVSTASRVKLEVCEDNHLYTYGVKWTDKEVYCYTTLENLENATYVYLVRVNGARRESIDPYGAASTESSRRSTVVNSDKIRMCNVPLSKMTSAYDVTIYEANVRDSTMQKRIDVTTLGEFRRLVEENEITKQQCSGFSYLETLGITHIQLVPAMDFGFVDENYPLMRYDWGYDSAQHRALEGSFGTEPANPYGRTFELIKLIEECHKQRTHVNLDIIFNHVYDKETHAFESTAPNYYSQVNENSDFSNGTYCGSDVDSRRNICHKYIVDACIYLIGTYRTDGFRFDLMGILNVAIINVVYGACEVLSPDFMAYDEGQDMPSFLDSGKRANISNNVQMSHVAHSSDRLRGVVKERTNTNEASVKGYCAGAVHLLNIMKSYLSGSCISIRMESMFTHPKNAVNYMECHDNMTSWDKLRECCKEDGKEVRIARVKMLMAAVLPTQGIPFIHPGQESVRSKHRFPDTYEESDKINKLDYLHRNQYRDVVKTTKDLIRTRKEHPILRYSMKGDVEQCVSFSDTAQKIPLCGIGDEYDGTVTTFNPTGEYFFYEFEATYPSLYYNEASEGALTKRVNTEPYNMTVSSRNDFLKPGI